MKLKEFFRPQSVEEAVRRVKEDPERGAYVAGGTDLLLEEDRSLDFVIDLIPLNLNYIRREDGEIKLGATAPISELERSPEIKDLADGILYKCAKQFSSLQLRNMATIGGNIASAVPSADFPPPLIALDAEAVIVGEEQRILPLKDVFIGPRKTILGSDILKELVIPIPPPTARCRFLKIARTPGGIALANLATLLEEEEGICKKIRIVAGGLAPTPLRVEEAEDFLQGKALTEENILKAAEIVAERVSPSFHRASPEYRRRMSYVLTERALLDSSKGVGWSSM